MTILIPVLGDQLSHALSSLAGQDKSACVILMAELDEETTYAAPCRRSAFSRMGR
jgi:deoxyribodipyrimidine photolyase-related protein